MKSDRERWGTGAAAEGIVGSVDDSVVKEQCSRGGGTGVTACATCHKKGHKQGENVFEDTFSIFLRPPGKGLS